MSPEGLDPQEVVYGDDYKPKNTPDYPNFPKNYGKPSLPPEAVKTYEKEN